LFRLERVLNLSRDRERLSEASLGEALRATAASKEYLQRSREDFLRESQEAMSLDGMVQARDLMVWSSRLGYLRGAIRIRVQEVTIAEEREVMQREELMRRRRDRMVLEHLRESRLAEHVKEGLREDQQAIDEMASQRHTGDS
jgi:flagellar export protein FliJ